MLRILYLKPVLVLIAFLIAACAELRSPSPGDLVGGWRYSDQILRCDYVFNRDGSFSGQVMDRGKLVSKFTGRWYIAGHTLNYTYLGDELERIPSGATDQDKLLRVGTSSFMIEAADGSTRTYRRVGFVAGTSYQ